VDHHIAHRAHLRPGNLLVLFDEVWGGTLNVVNGLADNLDIADNGILNLRILLNAARSGTGCR
jgi:hypothetical protein